MKTNENMHDRSESCRYFIVWQTKREFSPLRAEKVIWLKLSCYKYSPKNYLRMVRHDFFYQANSENINIAAIFLPTILDLVLITEKVRPKWAKEMVGLSESRCSDYKYIINFRPIPHFKKTEK